MSYWDTSALAKLYFPEADSFAFATKAATERIIVTARLSLFEMRRVAFRKESERLIVVGSAESVLLQLEQDCGAGEIQIQESNPRTDAEFNAIMVACYRRTPPVPIRTLDALHLASARVAGETELVGTDRRLREAAQILGFVLFPV